MFFGLKKTQGECSDPCAAERTFIVPHAEPSWDVMSNTCDPNSKIKNEIHHVAC